MTDIRAVTAAAITAPRSRMLPWVLLPIGIFLLTRVVDATFLLVAVREQYPSSRVPGGVVPILREPHSYLNVIQSWDGQWFRSIAEHGYPRTLPRENGVVVQNSWAFYPLFPGLVRVVMTATGASFGLAASLLNVALGATGMCVLFRLVEKTSTRFAALMSVLVLCTFPSAVVMQTAYAEPLTFVLLITSLWSLHHRRYGHLLVIGVLLSLARPVALPLALVTGLHGIARWRNRKHEPFKARERLSLAAVACALALSFALWPLVSWIVTGESHAFTTSMDAWKTDQDKVAGWQSWLSMAFTGHWAVLVMVVAALAAQAYFLLRPPAKLWSPELRRWSFSYAAYLLVATRPQSSFIRHLIMAIVPWWPFPEIGEVIRSRRQQVALAFLIAALGFVAQFFWIRWFWVPGPHLVSFP